MKRLVKLSVSCIVGLLDGAVRGLGRLAGRPPAGRNVVLYYHAVTKTQRPLFARQMETLLRLASPVRADTTEPAEPGERCVAITFDDAYDCVFRNAVPELVRRGIPATIFVPTRYLGEEAGWIPDELTRERCGVLATAEMLRDLVDGSITIGSHTVNHPNLVEVDEARARTELVESKASLESILGREVGLFSFPHGAHDDALVELCRACGYRRTFTIEPTLAFRRTDEFTTGRVSVEPDDWPLEFRLKATGAYRWLPAVFALKRRLRGM